MARLSALVFATATFILAAPVHAAALRIFSYDPADSETRHIAGGVTLEFKQHLTSTTVLRVLATEGQASADLKPAGARALGRGGLTALAGVAPERDLYEVQSTGEGPAMVAAFCPGATRAWMAFDRLRANRDLRVLVLGAASGSAAVHPCRTLNFSFHGEWRLPPGASFDERQLERPRFPH